MCVAARRWEIVAALLLCVALLAGGLMWLYLRYANQRLVEALDQDDRGTVRLLIRLGASLQTRGSAGETVLASAAGGDDLGFLKTVLDHGGDINGADVDGLTPLMYAIKPEGERAVDLLLARGANPRALTVTGDTPLALAACSGSPAMIRRLLAAGARINEPPEVRTWILLRTACFGFQYRNVAPLVAAGADVNARDQDGATPLMRAVEVPGEPIEMVQALLEAGADPTLRDHHGATALSRARKSHHFKIAALLERAAASFRPRP